MAAAISIKLKGDKALINLLNGLEPRVRRRVVRDAVRKAVTPWNQAAKARVPEGHLAVRRSIGRKRKTYARTKTVVMLVGPRVFTSGFKDSDGKVKTAAKTAAEAQRLEFGTIDRPATPFMRPAFNEKKAEVERIAAVEIGRGIDKEARKKR